MKHKGLQIPQLAFNNIDRYTQSRNIDTKRTFSTSLNTNRYLMKTHLTKQILEQCLESFDIFKQINEDAVLKRKLIKDVLKLIIIKIYDEEGIIFNKGQSAQSIYMIIKGSVSLCLPISKDNPKNEFEDSAVSYQYKQIDIYSKGDGFGEAEFIVRKKRGLLAKAKVDNTVIGVLQCDAFEQIIQNFRTRDYLKKMDMFSKCPLLNHLQKYALEFIVNNSKPVIFPIFKQIAAQNENAKGIYLITSGQIQLKKSCSQSKPHNNKYYTHHSSNDGGKIKLNNFQVGIIDSGQFLGDTELALGITYGYTAVTKSQKVRAYACDERIIMSQMNEQAFKNAKIYYTHRNSYHQKKEKIYQTVKDKLIKQIEGREKNILNKVQMKLKRRINVRYVEKIPTLIGQLSPRQIQIIVNKKYMKIKTQAVQCLNAFPYMEIQKKDRKLKANQNSYSPYLKKMQQYKKSISKFSSQDQQLEYDEKKPFLTNNESIQTINYQVSNEKVQLLLPFMSSVRNKAHDKLFQQYGRNKTKSYADGIQKNELIVSLQHRGNRRFDEFKANIQKYKNKSHIFQQYNKS